MKQQEIYGLARIQCHFLLLMNFQCCPITDLEQRCIEDKPDDIDPFGYVYLIGDIRQSQPVKDTLFYNRN